MRASVNTRTMVAWDFPIGHAPRKQPVRMCEDCRQRPARPHTCVCFGCGRIRERISGANVGR